MLTHWGRVTHICVGKLTILDSENGLSPERRQAIIETNDGILLIRTSGTNFSEILSEIHAFSFKKIHLKTSSGKWWPSCLGLNELTLLMLEMEYSGFGGQHHACWYPGSYSRHRISRHDVGCAGQTICIVTPGLIASTWLQPNRRYDLKCEYILCNL